MSFVDALGVVGVLLVLAAYAGAQIGRLEPRDLPSLLMNFGGSGLILWSLCYKFNMSAVLMEGSWALVSLYGLVRWAMRRRRAD